MKANIIQIKKDEVLFYQGSEEKVLYKVLTGEIQIVSDFGGIRQKELARMKPGDCFGEMAILDNEPRSATAIATEDSSLMEYPEELMTAFIAKNPNFALSVMQGLSTKLRNATKEIEAIQGLLIAFKKDRRISDYIERHTEYSADGTPHFSIKI